MMKTFFFFYFDLFQRGNKLKAMENLSQLLFLQTLDVSGNFINSLQGLTSNGMLEVLDIENNHVSSRML